MRYVFRPLDGLLRERRLLRDQPDGAKEQDLKKMENLHMAEFREKSKNAYDKVNDRVQEYRTETQKLRNQLSAVRNSNSQWQNLQQRRLRNVEENTGRITREIGKTYKTYSDDVLKQMSAGNKNIAKMAQLQDRLFYRVDVLENFYTHVETTIGNVEKDLLAKNINVQPTLKERMLARRMETFDKQRNSTNEQDQLRTIEIDWYSQPFNKMENRAYHLLRLPGNADVSFEGSPLPQKGRDYDEINLSGGAKYVKFTSEFMQRIPAEEPLPFRMRLAFPDPNGGPDQVHIATPHKTTDGLNNLTFSFEQRPQTERKPRRPIFEQRPQQPPAEQKPPAEKKELPPQEKKELPPQDKKELPPQDKPNEPIRLRRKETAEPAPVPQLEERGEPMSLDRMRDYLSTKYLPSLDAYFKNVPQDKQSVAGAMKQAGFADVDPQNTNPDTKEYTFSMEKDARRIVVIYKEGKLRLQSVDYTKEYKISTNANFLGNTFHRLNTFGATPVVINQVKEALERVLKDTPEAIDEILAKSGCNVSSITQGLTRAELPLKDGKTLVIEIQNGKLLSCGLGVEKKEMPKDVVAQMKEIFDALRQGSDKINGAVVRAALDTLAAAFPDPQALLKVLTDLGIAAKIEGQKVVASLNIGNNVLVFSIENGKVTEAGVQVPNDEPKSSNAGIALIVPLIAVAAVSLVGITYKKARELGAKETKVEVPKPTTKVAPSTPEVPAAKLELPNKLDQATVDRILKEKNPGKILGITGEVSEAEIYRVSEHYKMLCREAQAKGAIKEVIQMNVLIERLDEAALHLNAKIVLRSTDQARILGVGPNATLAEMEDAFFRREAMCRYLETKGHPEAAQLREKVHNAYKTLSKGQPFPEVKIPTTPVEESKPTTKSEKKPKPQEKKPTQAEQTTKNKPDATGKPAEARKPRNIPPLSEEARARIRGSSNPTDILGLGAEDMKDLAKVRKARDAIVLPLLKDPTKLREVNTLIMELHNMEVLAGHNAEALKKNPEWKNLKEKIKALLKDPKDIHFAEKAVKARVKAEMDINAGREPKAPGAGKKPSARPRGPERTWPSKEALFKNYLRNPDNVSDLNRVRDCFQHIENAFADAKKLGPDNLRAIVAQNLEEIRGCLKNPADLAAVCEDYGRFVKNAPWKGVDKTIWPVAEGAPALPNQQKPAQIGMDKPKSEVSKKSIRDRKIQVQERIKGFDAQDPLKARARLMEIDSKVTQYEAELRSLESGNNTRRMQLIKDIGELRAQEGELRLLYAEGLLKKPGLLYKGTSGTAAGKRVLEIHVMKISNARKAVLLQEMGVFTQDEIGLIMRAGVAGDISLATDKLSATNAVIHGAPVAAETGNVIGKVSREERYLQKLLQAVNPQDPDAVRKFLQLAQVNKQISLDVKTMNSILQSKGAQDIVRGAMLSADPQAEMARALRMAKGAQAWKTLGNVATIGGDVFMLWMAAEDMQQYGFKIDAAKRTGNKKLQALYEQGRICPIVQGGVSCVGLAVSGYAIVSAAVAGHGLLGAVAASGSMVMLPLALATMAGVETYKAWEEIQAYHLTQAKDLRGKSGGGILEHIDRSSSRNGSINWLQTVQIYLPGFDSRDQNLVARMHGYTAYFEDLAADHIPMPTEADVLAQDKRKNKEVKRTPDEMKKAIREIYDNRVKAYVCQAIHYIRCRTPSLKLKETDDQGNYQAEELATAERVAAMRFAQMPIENIDDGVTSNNGQSYYSERFSAQAEGAKANSEFLNNDLQQQADSVASFWEHPEMFQDLLQTFVLRNIRHELAVAELRVLRADYPSWTNTTAQGTWNATQRMQWMTRGALAAFVRFNIRHMAAEVKHADKQVTRKEIITMVSTIQHHLLNESLRNLGGKMLENGATMLEHWGKDDKLLTVEGMERFLRGVPLETPKQTVPREGTSDATNKDFLDNGMGDKDFIMKGKEMKLTGLAGYRFNVFPPEAAKNLEIKNDGTMIIKGKMSIWFYRPGGSDDMHKPDFKVNIFEGGSGVRTLSRPDMAADKPQPLSKIPSGNATLYTKDGKAWISGLAGCSIQNEVIDLQTGKFQAMGKGTPWITAETVFFEGPGVFRIWLPHQDPAKDAPHTVLTIRSTALESNRDARVGSDMLRKSEKSGNYHMRYEHVDGKRYTLTERSVDESKPDEKGAVAIFGIPDMDSPAVRVYTIRGIDFMDNPGFSPDAKRIIRHMLTTPHQTGSQFSLERIFKLFPNIKDRSAELAKKVLPLYESEYADKKEVLEQLFDNLHAGQNIDAVITKLEKDTLGGTDIAHPLEIDPEKPPKAIQWMRGKPLFLELPDVDWQWGAVGADGKIAESLIVNKSQANAGKLQWNGEAGNLRFWRGDSDPAKAAETFDIQVI